VTLNRTPARLRYNFILQGDTTPGDTKLLRITKKWKEMTGKNDLIVVTGIQDLKHKKKAEIKPADKFQTT
jgi:hypothetical protein